MDKYGTLLSQIHRFFVYSFQRPKMQLENGMFIISVDVDVGSKELGIINEGRNDANVSSYFSEYSIGEIEEQASPLLIDLFNHFDIAVTFAVRGQLAVVHDSILEILLKSSVKHDIGTHGYYHKDFKSLSYNEAENELKMISVGMKRFGIIPKSFVFPRNGVAHLDLLQKYGYKSFRGSFRPFTCIEKEGSLYNVQETLFIGQNPSSKLLKRFIDVCIAKKLFLHFWFHPWNFGKSKGSIQRNINKLLFPFLKYAQQKVKSGTLTFETMLSASEKVEKLALN